MALVFNQEKSILVLEVISFEKLSLIKRFFSPLRLYLNVYPVEGISITSVCAISTNRCTITICAATRNCSITTMCEKKKNNLYNAHGREGRIRAACVLFMLCAWYVNCHFLGEASAVLMIINLEAWYLFVPSNSAENGLRSCMTHFVFLVNVY